MGLGGGVVHISKDHKVQTQGSKYKFLEYGKAIAQVCELF